MKSILLHFGFALIWLGNQLAPKRRQLLLSAFPDVEDQMVSILRWLRDHPAARLPVYLLVVGNESEVRNRLRLLVGGSADEIHIVRKMSLRGIWTYWRSRYVFFTHGLYGFLPVAGTQTVVNLWHGMPLKRVWKGLSGSHVPGCTFLLSTSDKYSEIQAEASGFPVAKIPATGLPRNDLLFSETSATRRFSDAVAKGADRVLLFLPTYRKSTMGFVTGDGIETDSALAMSEDEVAVFSRMLAETCTRILVKPHPMSAHYGNNAKLNDWIWIISDNWLQQQGVTLYEALGRMDGLITDVSSVYVDFLSLQKPMFFYFPDLVEYRKTRTFQVEPVEDWLAGPLCTTVPELVRSLREFVSGQDKHAGRRRELGAVLNPRTQPGATAQVFALIGASTE